MEQPNYPYFKLTLDEKFPRLLITRRPWDKSPEQKIYGAFLPVGMTRRMFDLLLRLFRLRPCELDVQGDFDAPCPEYFLRRCLAPCVSEICSRQVYLETIEIVKLILANKFHNALMEIDRKINDLAEVLNFEHAAEWRDKRATVEEIASNSKWQINASTMTEVVTLKKQKDASEIVLTTLRRGKTVGKAHFVIDNTRGETEIVGKFITDYYKFYAPKNIYVASDLPEKKSIEADLKLKFGRAVKIQILKPENHPPSIIKAENLAKHSYRNEKTQKFSDKTELLAEIRSIFNLKKNPRCIECFDVAHLAGREIITGRVAAVNGFIQTEENLVWEFENLTETAALSSAIYERLRLLIKLQKPPDLLLIDGGKPQINAVSKVLKQFGLEDLPIIGAVKPPKQHNQIGYFLDNKGLRIKFDKFSKPMNFLQSLRDAAHNLANETHRELHSLVQIFKNNHETPQIKYLLVPKRFAERGGDAADLSPIRSMSQAGEILLKSKKSRKSDDY